MSFPKNLAKKFAAAGRLVAQMRIVYRDKTGLGDYLVFVMFSDNAHYHVCGVKHYDDGIPYSSWQHEEADGNKAATRIQSYILNWMEQGDLSMAEWEVWDDTEEGKAFLSRMLVDFPGLDNVTPIRRRKTLVHAATQGARPSFRDWLSQQPNAARLGRFGPVILA